MFNNLCFNSNYKSIATDEIVMIYVVKFIFIFNENNNVPDYECLSSDGSYVEWIPDFSEIVIEKVISEKEDDDNDNIVVSYSVNTGLCSQISYDSSKITAKWKEYFEDFYSGDISLSDVKKLGLPDTDGDGTPDCIEIDMKYISFDEKGNMVLPTYDDMASDALKNSAFGLDGLDDLFAILSQKGCGHEKCIYPAIKIKSDNSR